MSQIVDKNRTIHLKIQRYNPDEKRSYQEEFLLDYQPNLNLVSVLMLIQEQPINALGEQVFPVAWDCNCLNAVCGACVMLINGVPKEACSTQIDHLLKEGEVIYLAPLSKFPVLRDLIVDRTALFDALKKSEVWINPTPSEEAKTRIRISPKEQQWTYPISRCMTCGCCVEACPNSRKNSHFIGPQAIAQVLRIGAHPRGKTGDKARLEALVGEDGIHHCGNSHNCKIVCPQEIDLPSSIGKANGKATVYTLKKHFNNPKN